MCNCCVHVTLGDLGICCKVFKCWERWTLFWGLHSHNRATSIENCLFFFYIKDIQIWSDGKSCISSPMRRRFTMAKKHSYSINRTWSNFPEPVHFSSSLSVVSTDVGKNHWDYDYHNSFCYCKIIYLLFYLIIQILTMKM